LNMKILALEKELPASMPIGTNRSLKPKPPGSGSFNRKGLFARFIFVPMNPPPY